ncbi:hypothetical protein F511_11031 [Dorcoceras hygrometricum]|uniref:Uncharacterized protein n=1 Tax=Dorcoceras hygrometricum TaxID=472368 RepID=A0A2Z7CHH6_9LAMI|nr:hypothetical protein F511_11031 [Dorcoceras hygrometricum]
MMGAKTCAAFSIQRPINVRESSANCPATMRNQCAWYHATCARIHPSLSCDTTVGEPWRIRSLPTNFASRKSAHIGRPAAAHIHARPPHQTRNQCAGQCQPLGRPMCGSSAANTQLCAVKACNVGDDGRKNLRSLQHPAADQRSRTPQNPPQVLNTLSSVSVRKSRIQYLCDPQWFRDTASRGPTTIVAPESQFRTCPSDHDSIGYPRMSASGESSTTMHRLLHASGPHPIPPPNDPKTNQYNQDLGLIHSTNGNHLESLNEGSSIDHQVAIYLHAQNITMFPTNETWYESSSLSSFRLEHAMIDVVRRAAVFYVKLKC